MSKILYHQDEMIIDADALKVWRDDPYKVPFSRHCPPKSFAERIYSYIPGEMPERSVLLITSLTFGSLLKAGEFAVTFFSGV